MCGAALHITPIRVASLAAALLLAIGLQAPLAQPADRDVAAAPTVAYASRLLAAINGYRVEHGLVPLRKSDKLDMLADNHRRNMAQANRLSHERFRERQARAASPICVENVGWNYGTPDAQLKGWIDSPSHNGNLLDGRITQAGVGEASGYVTFIACL